MPKFRAKERPEKSKLVKELRRVSGCAGWDRSTIIVDDASAARRELVACHPNTQQMGSNFDWKWPECTTAPEF